MQQNYYDDAAFFDKYRAMERSQKGLEAAGEWHALRKMLPDFNGKRVLDLGCGFGWHCRYAALQGAAAVVGVDLSEKMLEAARGMTTTPTIRYMCLPIEEIDFPTGSFDIVLSSLAIHYLPSFDSVCAKVWSSLVPGGHFVFSVEHPIFTAAGPQNWHTDAGGQRLHWPVDRYFAEGVREAVFLGETMEKYHRTVATYAECLLKAGFAITGIDEPQPDPVLLQSRPEWRDELRRPMMLLFAAVKHA